MKVKAYIDYKSGSSFLALKPILELAENYPITLQWIPLNINFAEIYGDPETRNNRQINKVKYMFWEGRKFAEEQNLVMMSPKKIYDTRLASIMGLFCQDKGKIDLYNQIVFERFFKREIDVEDVEEMYDVLRELDLDPIEFENYFHEKGQVRYYKNVQMSERDGVFGVPSLIIDRQLYFGGNRMNWVRRHLDQLFKKGSAA